jgi:TolA-binding protein
MIDIRCGLLTGLVLAAVHTALLAQSTVPIASASSSPSESEARSVELEQKLETISSSLVAAHRQLQQSQQEIEQLREQLAQIKKQLGLLQPAPAESSGTGSFADAAQATAATIEGLQEQQQTLEAQVKVHDQTKLESSSKYPVRVSGLILFNSFINRGTVDNTDLPEVALTSQGNTTGNGSIGASFRQTILGIEGYGPRIAGARTSASVDVDFFGGLAYTSYGT